MRPGRAGLRLAALIALAAAPLFAADPWYESYEGALKAVAARQWGIAETKLKAALKDGPKPGRRVRTYGMRYVDYLPEYYLGLVYFNQQRQREALEQLRKVSASGLVSQGDAEYPALADMLGKAEASLAPKPEPSKAPAEAPRAMPPESPKAVAEAPPKPSQPPAEPPRAASAAPTAPQRPRAIEPPPASALPKRSAAAPPAEVQRAALRVFFAGRYEESAQQLEEIAAGPGRSAPALFYLGASHAAIGLMRDEGRSERLDRARRIFGEARRLDPRFEADPGLVSPRILRLWRETSP